MKIIVFLIYMLSVEITSEMFVKKKKSETKQINKINKSDYLINFNSKQ